MMRRNSKKGAGLGLLLLAVFVGLAACSDGIEDPDDIEQLKREQVDHIDGFGDGCMEPHGTEAYLRTGGYAALG